MKDRKYCFIVLQICLLLGFGNIAFAEGDFKIGKVDFYSIILLHPAMKDFDVNKNAFVITRNQTETEELKKEEEQRKQKVKEYEIELLGIRKNILDLEAKHIKKINGMNDKYSKAIKKLASDAVLFETMNLKIDTRKEYQNHERDVRILETKFSEIQNRLYEIKDVQYEVGYTTPQETEKKFEFIIAEIKKYVKTIADLKGVSVVLNSSNRQFKKPSRANQFRNLPNYTIDLFGFELPKSQYKDEAGVIGFYETLNDYVHSWLEHGSFVLENLRDKLKDCDIVIGGEDLTSEVLYSLYRDYKIDQNIANAIIQNVINY